MSKLPSLEEMLKAGLHFGHQKSKWHPKMAPFIFTEKNKVHIVNLEETQKQLAVALAFAREVVLKGGSILFLGTKKQAQAAVKEAAARAGMPYITGHWLGGTFTNAKSVLGLVKNYRHLKAEKEAGRLSRYTKREQLKFQRKIESLEPVIGGIESLTNIPQAVFIIDVKTEMTAVKEANKMRVPIIALCDTNVNPDLITYVIPGNDDAVKGVKLIVDAMADAIVAAREEKAASVPAPAVKVEPAPKVEPILNA
jgi:small subunit ribosomal protein S2